MRSANSLEKPDAARCFRRQELVVWVVALAAINAPLLAGGSTAGLAFQPQQFLSGEWWRLFTHPFIHVSWYHFVLDGVAFLLLWHSMEGRLRSRLSVIVASAAGSLLTAAVFSSDFRAVGLCGLSGVAHGLMAKQGLDLLPDGRTSQMRRLGAALVLGVFAKSLYEAITGGALFGGWHFALLGTPIVICHLGGACGATALHLLRSVCGRRCEGNDSRESESPRVIASL